MDSPSSYRILIKGCLNPRWSEWFDGLTITRTSDGETMLSGRVLDQAELYGLLNKLRDLGLPLISVKSICVGLRRESTIEILDKSHLQWGKIKERANCKPAIRSYCSYRILNDT